MGWAFSLEAKIVELFSEFVQMVSVGVLISFFAGIFKRLLFSGDDPL